MCQCFLLIEWILCRKPRVNLLRRQDKKNYILLLFHSISTMITKTTSPKTEARMCEIWLAAVVLQTYYIPYIRWNALVLLIDTFRKIQHRCTSTKLSWWHVIVFHVQLVKFHFVIQSLDHLFGMQVSKAWASLPGNETEIRPGSRDSLHWFVLSFLPAFIIRRRCIIYIITFGRRFRTSSDLSSSMSSFFL